MAITKLQARALWEYYDKLITTLINAKMALVSGGVKSYTIDDRSLTKLDIDKLGLEIEDAVRQRAVYAALINGRGPRKAVGIIPRNW